MPFSSIKSTMVQIILILNVFRHWSYYPCVKILTALRGSIGCCKNQIAPKLNCCTAVPNWRSSVQNQINTAPAEPNWRVAGVQPWPRPASPASSRADPRHIQPPHRASTACWSCISRGRPPASEACRGAALREVLQPQAPAGASVRAPLATAATAKLGFMRMREFCWGFFMRFQRESR
jgi:hypothetical protein